MNSIERLARCVRLQPTDQTPVIVQIFGCAARIAGVGLERYVRDGELLAQCQLDAWRRYRYDAVFTVMDVSVEAEALGSALRVRPDQYPVIDRHALTAGGDWSGLTPPDPQRAGRMPEMLKALSILRRELKDDAAVVGCVMGPLTLTTQLLGMEAALYLAIDDSPRLERLMDFATDVVTRFGQAQLAAGAHLVVVFDPSASPAVVPPPFFREFELPRLRRVFDALAAAGSAAGWLHIAGPTQGILPYYPQAGADIANFDYCVSADEARRLLPATCVDGNVRPLAFVEASPSETRAECDSLLAGFGDRGGFILSSGCEIPVESNPDNIAAMVEAAHAAR